jgi:hypothetical protein
LTSKVHITEPRIKSGATNPAPKLTTLIAGMCAGADSIDEQPVGPGQRHPGAVRPLTPLTATVPRCCHWRPGHR